MTRPVPRPAVGATYRLDEADYRYGRGPLIVRVSAVLASVEYDGEQWWHVEAMCAVPKFTGPAGFRTVYLRAYALTNSVVVRG